MLVGVYLVEQVCAYKLAKWIEILLCKIPFITTRFVKNDHS